MKSSILILACAVTLSTGCAEDLSDGGTFSMRWRHARILEVGLTESSATTQAVADCRTRSAPAAHYALVHFESMLRIFRHGQDAVISSTPSMQVGDLVLVDTAHCKFRSPDPTR